jgi:hypothetical protein
MPARLQSLRFTAMVLAACYATTQGNAQQASVSPFLPTQGAAAAGAATPGAPLEYRGTMETADGALYRIVDPARKAGAWVKLNERDPTLDFVVKQHEGSGDNETVVVEQGGRSFTLSLRTAKVVSSGAAGQGFVPPPPNAVASNVPPSVTNSVVINPTPADEQRRLEAVAAEVARRRALREQATQQINQGQPVIPAVPQQTMPQALPPPPAQLPTGQRPQVVYPPPANNNNRPQR